MQCRGTIQHLFIMEHAAAQVSVVDCLQSALLRCMRVGTVRTVYMSVYVVDALPGVLTRWACVQNVRAVAAGGAHTAAVTECSVYSWGSNSAGQLGSRTFRDKASPTEVKDLTAKGVVQVACGSEHSLFLCRCFTTSSALASCRTLS